MRSKKFLKEKIRNLGLFVFFTFLAIFVFMLLLFYKPANISQAPRPIEFTTVEKGLISSAAGPNLQFLRIASEEEWSEFWQKHKKDSEKLPPDIDFGHEMVLVLIDSFSKRGVVDSFVAIQGIEEKEGILKVSALRTIQTGKECFRPQIIGASYHIVKLKKSNLEPKLGWQVKEIPC